MTATTTRQKMIRRPERKSLPPLRTKACAFVGGKDTAALATMGTLIGKPVDGVLAYGDNASITANAFRLDPLDVNGWPASVKMTLGLPLVPSGVQNMATIAAGSLDAQYDTAAQNLKPYLDRIICVRIGWECNGDWYPWSLASTTGTTNATAPNYIACFRRYAEAIRRHCPSVLIEWNVNHDKPVNDAMYPGDDFVDVVAIDAYLNSSFAADSFPPFLTAPSGLNWLENFGDRHDKLIAIGEWATNYNTGGFIDGMAAWMQRRPLLYHGYWNGDPGTFNGILSDKANASAAYVRNFGVNAPAP